MEKYLQMVNGAINSNKVYRMVENGDGTWTAFYGREGAALTKKVYGMSSWDKKYKEKLAKGYVDVTNIHSLAGTTVDTGFAPIEEPSVREFFNEWIRRSDEVIKQNYSVTASEVNASAVKQAQEILGSLQYVSDTREFNQKLDFLFAIIPRKMSQVQAYHIRDAADEKEKDKILAREQALLDTIASRVSMHVDSAAPVKQGETILDHYGLDIRPCTASESAMVEKHLVLGPYGKFSRCWHAYNAEERKNFDAYCRANNISGHGIKMYYHGSRTENYFGITTKGLQINPAKKVVRSGAMFGHGLYFAPKAQKSMGYTSVRGAYWSNRGQHGCATDNTAYLLIYKVAMGKTKHLNGYSSEVCNWHEAECRKAGFHSVFAHEDGGQTLRNDEAIIYNEHACALAYIVEIKV